MIPKKNYCPDCNAQARTLRGNKRAREWEKTYTRISDTVKDHEIKDICFIPKF
ncbi:MAG: hypothetical protein IJN63_00655 [Clostridia bacterium]|nr:hypothetical protein [Clostridia bacterium]